MESIVEYIDKQCQVPNPSIEEIMEDCHVDQSTAEKMLQKMTSHLKKCQDKHKSYHAQTFRAYKLVKSQLEIEKKKSASVSANALNRIKQAAKDGIRKMNETKVTEGILAYNQIPIILITFPLPTMKSFDSQ